MGYIISRQSDNTIQSTGSTAMKVGSCRPKTACTQENVQHVEDAICSPENSPGTQRSLKYTASDHGVSRYSVQKMILKSWS